MKLTNFEREVVIRALERTELDGNWFFDEREAMKKAIGKLHALSKTESVAADPRHRRFMELIQRAHQHYVKVQPILGSSTGNNLKRLLKGAGPSLTENRFVRMLKHYHESEDHSPADSPAYYISKLPKYELGPLNKYGRADATN